MAFEHKDRVYSGETSDILLIISHATKEMEERDLSQFKLSYQTSDGEVSVEIKR